MLSAGSEHFCSFYVTYQPHWNEVLQITFSPSFCSFWGVFEIPFQDRRRTRLLCWRRTLRRGGRTRFALVTNALVLETNAFVLETNALTTCLQNSATHTASHQRLSNRTYMYLEMIAAHLRKRAFALSHSCSYRIFSKNLSPKVFKEIRHLVAFRIGIREIAQGDEHLDYPGETLERIAKLWNALVIVK